MIMSGSQMTQARVAKSRYCAPRYLRRIIKACERVMDLNQAVTLEPDDWAQNGWRRAALVQAQFSKIHRQLEKEWLHASRR